MNRRILTALCFSLILCGSLLVAGCTTAPQNGQTFDGPTTGQSYSYSGLAASPGLQITVQVLADASADPTDESQWVTLGTTTTATSWVVDPVGDLWYPWSLNAASTSSMWPQGGLQRIRVRDATGMNLVTFDEDGSVCLISNADQGFLLAGAECASPYGFATMVSTVPSPAEINPPAYLSYSSVVNYAPIDSATTDLYYAAMQAPQTLQDFKQQYNFEAADPSEVSATYFNYPDLGLGREMHCVTYLAGLNAAGTNEYGTACYVTNYDGVGNGTFPTDPHNALSDAIDRTRAFATVAMIYNPLMPDPMTGERLPPEYSIQFVVFNGQGDRVNIAPLDSKGDNTSVPINCLVCHGGSYDADKNLAKYAHFLPFDVFRFKYADDLGIDNPAYTLSAQADNFRRLNAHAYHAGATSDIKKMIDNMYGGKGAAQGVEDYASNPMASAEEYVPESWHRVGKDKVYNAIVKPYCRTCHISREEAPDNPFIWEEYPKFEIYLASVQHLVCGTHEMPNAEQTLKNFWNSSARAHLAGAFPNEMRGACKPED